MKPEPQQDCTECLTDELRPENVAPVHDQSRLFVDSQVGYDELGCAKTPDSWRLLVNTIKNALAQTDGRTEVIALPFSLMWSVRKK